MKIETASLLGTSPEQRKRSIVRPVPGGGVLCGVVCVVCDVLCCVVVVLCCVALCCVESCCVALC